MPALSEATLAGFGLALQAGPGVELEGLGLLGGLDGDTGEMETTQRPTRIVVDSEGLCRRVREATVRTEVAALGEGDASSLRVELLEGVGYLVSVQAYGGFLVSSDGSEVLCDPLEARENWASILPAQVLPLAATLRGLEPLHASGVVLDGAAVLFSGPPGTGKSSLAAALFRGGASVLADDVVTLDRRAGSLLVHPGAALLHLRAAEHERLSAVERQATGEHAPFAGKQRYGGTATAAGPAPFGSLFLLEWAESGVEIERLESPDPRDLLAASFNLSVRTPERLVRQLDATAALAKSGAVHRLRILPGRDATALAAAVADWLAGVRI